MSRCHKCDLKSNLTGTLPSWPRQEAPGATLNLELQGLPRAVEEVFPGAWLMSESSGTLWYLVLAGDTWHGKPVALVRPRRDEGQDDVSGSGASAFFFWESCSHLRAPG